MDEIPPKLRGKSKVIALYCRISIDKKGRKEGVAKQEKWGRAYADEHWPGIPVEVFSDNDLTAADATVIRPEFERLRVWISEGRVANIWVVEQFRFVRRPSEWFMVADELTAAGIDEIHTNRDGVVIVEDEVAGIKAVLGGGEVRRMKRRLTDTLAEHAAEGLPPAGLPAGYRHVRLRGVRTYQVVTEQWEPRWWAAQAVLDGWSLESATAELRRRGVPGAYRRHVLDDEGEPVTDPETGEPVTTPTILTAGALRSWLLSPTVAGLRTHRGKIVGRGKWPPLLCDDPHAPDAHEKAAAVHERLVAKLSTPREVQTSDGRVLTVTIASIGQRGRTRRRYLLTGGKIKCGTCTALLAGSLKKFKNGSHPYYLCNPSRGGKGCVGMKAEDVEKRVRDLLFAKVAKPGYVERFMIDQHAERREAIEAELGGMERKRRSLAGMWAADSLDDDEWQAARATLDEREATIKAELATIPPPPQGIDLRVLRDPRVWESLNLGERREIIDMFVESVTLVKAKQPYSRVDPSRVKVKFK